MKNALYFNLPRRFGRSFTTSQGKTYIFYHLPQGGALYRVDFMTRRVVGITNCAHTDEIICQMPAHQGVPKWAYKLLRTQKPEIILGVMPTPACSDELPEERQSDELLPEAEPLLSHVDEVQQEILPVIDIPVQPSMFDSSQLKVFWKKTSGRIVALVLGEDNDPKTAQVFHINADGKASCCLNGSKGQMYTIEQLPEKGWKDGKLGDEQFAVIREILEPEQSAIKAETKIEHEPVDRESSAAA
jgi:hypothetical protein